MKTKYMQSLRLLMAVVLSSTIITACAKTSVPFLRDTLLSSITKKGNIIACGDDRVLIMDGAAARNNKSQVLWSFKATEVEGQLPAGFLSLLRTFDDCKPVDNNTKLLLTSSGGGTILLDIKTRKVLFHARTPMAHAAAWLPGGKIGVANSTHKQGNNWVLYDVERSDKPLYTDSLYSGHGIVWNDKNNTLAVLGYSLLKIYQIKSLETATPAISLLRSYDLPDAGGHDLSMVTDDTLLVTTHDGVWTFDVPTGTFKNFDGVPHHKNVKSVNVNSIDKSIVYTVAEESWWTYNIYGLNPAFRLYIPDIHLYKCRLFQ